MSVQRQFVLAVVTDINQNKVTYPSCTQCYTKLLVDQTTQRYHCMKCSSSIPSQSVQWRYRLVLTVADNTAVSQVVVFGRTLEQFFGKTGTDFHRSLMGLDRSGYPAEALLTEALNNTFHGKYFYFGVKLLSSHNTETAPTLSCINQGGSGPSQSMLNTTDLLETSNILVYQMIPSNNGVYATVSDFIRQGIKLLRKTFDKSDNSSANFKLSEVDISVECSINQSEVNTESSLSKSGSFSLKQKSVALSFETSTEESVEIVRGDFGYDDLTGTLLWNEAVICNIPSLSQDNNKEGPFSTVCQKYTGSDRNVDVAISSDSSFLEEDSLNRVRKTLFIDNNRPIAACLSITERSEKIQQSTFNDDPVWKRATERSTDKLNSIDLPDSEDLEEFLNSFSCSIEISQGKIPKHFTKCLSRDKENSLNGDRNEMFINAKSPISASLSTKDRSDTIQHSTFNDDIFQNRAVERSSDKLNSMNLPDSEDLEEFLNSFSTSIEIFDSKYSQNTFNRNSSSKITNIEHDMKDLKVTHNPLCLDKRNTSNKISDGVEHQEIENMSDSNRELIVENMSDIHTKIVERSENNSDSGLNLSTSSCDLFVSLELFSTKSYGDSQTDLNDCDLDKSNVDFTTDIVNDNMKDNNHFLEELFSDSWFEHTQNDVLEDMPELQVERQEKKDRSNDTSKTLAEGYKTCTVRHENIQANKPDNPLFSPTIQQSIETESLLNTTDILFDSPQLSVAQEKHITGGKTKCGNHSLSKAVVKTFWFPSDKITSAHQHTLSVGQSIGVREDDSIVVESQSTLFESDTSLSKSCNKEKSTVGALDVGKKVKFSKKLRRISSCRLMDIKMKESKPSSILRVVTPKSCLKPSVQVHQNKFELKHENKADTRIDCFLPDESCNDDADSSFFLESSQPSKVQELLSGPCSGNIPSENVLTIKTHKDCLPLTPDLWDSSFDKDCLPSTPDLSGSSFDDSDLNGELNEAITQETPATSHTIILKERNGRDSKYNSNSRSSRVLGCLNSTPELFSETFLCNSQLLKENSVETDENRENVIREVTEISSDKAKTNDGMNRPILKYLVKNTPGCDSSVISNGPSNIGNKDNYSPDLFCDSSFEDCDNNLNHNLYSVPSVLCKQLFF